MLRHPAFRNLWIARTLSSVGDRLVLVALALYVSEIGSATDVGIVLGVQTVLLVAFLLIGGVLADRLPRAKVMITTDLARAALHLLLAGLIIADVVTVWQIVAIEALFGVAEAFFQPAYSGLLPRTVPDAEIQDAQALTNLTENLAELLGPALATVLVLGIGPEWAFLFDAATFLLGFVFMLRVHVVDEPTSRARRRRRWPSSPTASGSSDRARGSGSRWSPSPSRSRSATRRCSSSAPTWRRAVTTRRPCSGS